MLFTSIKKRLQNVVSIVHNVLPEFPSVTTSRQHGAGVLIRPVSAIVVAITVKVFVNAFLVVTLKLILTTSYEINSCQTYYKIIYFQEYLYVH